MDITLSWKLRHLLCSPPQMGARQYDGWKYPTHYQQAGNKNQIFAKDTWVGAFDDNFQLQPGDVLVKEHWGSSGLPNTDLDYLLRRHGYEKIILIGMLMPAGKCSPKATGLIARCVIAEACWPIAGWNQYAVVARIDFS
jgi:hypothetical protein